MLKFKKKFRRLKVKDYAAETQFQWRFIPKNSPHFGGLWEAGVKSLKCYWKRKVSRRLLIFYVFSIFIAQIEALLNSWTLIALSHDPNDSSCLSLGHFLIDAPLTSLPEPEFTSTTMNSLSSWQQSSTLQSAVTIKVDIWLLEQLATMQTMVQQATRLPARNACAALLRPFTSHIFEINNHHETFPGPDGHIRIARVITNSGQLSDRFIT